ncbi:RPL19B [Symbiodinium sp. KB8]|nr:RPL19B [Symbiodinium sp. KB8]
MRSWWMLLSLCLRTEAQIRAAQQACRGQANGSLCHYLWPRSASSGQDASESRIAWGHCYLLDVWRDGSGGLFDFDGRLRSSMLACLEDDKLTADELAAMGFMFSPGADNENGATSASRLTQILAWVVGGGWQVLAVVSSTLCCLLAAQPLGRHAYSPKMELIVHCCIVLPSVLHLLAAVRTGSIVDPRSTVVSIDAVGGVAHVSRHAMLTETQAKPAAQSFASSMLPTARTCDADGEFHAVRKSEGDKQGDLLISAFYAVASFAQHLVLAVVRTQFRENERVLWLDDIHVIAAVAEFAARSDATRQLLSDAETRDEFDAVDVLSHGTHHWSGQRPSRRYKRGRTQGQCTKNNREFGEFLRGWQHRAAFAGDKHALELQVSHIDAASRALLLSQAGQHVARARAPSTVFPTSADVAVPAPLFRVLLLQRLRLKLPVAPRTCACRGRVDTLGNHSAACATSALLASRALHLERAVARVCQEAGVWVARNVRQADMNIDVPVSDDRRIEVVANGLSLRHGTQQAVDSMPPSSAPYHGDVHPGRAVDGAARRKRHQEAWGWDLPSVYGLPAAVTRWRCSELRLQGPPNRLDATYAA